MSANAIVVLTGASGPLGREFLLALGERDDIHVVAITRRARMGALGRNITLLARTDLADASASKKLRRVVMRTRNFRTSTIHVINCAGAFPVPASVGETTPAVFLETVKSNLVTVYSAAHALLPLMAKKRGGCFVSFSSHTTDFAFPLTAAFNTTKAGLTVLSRSIANEYGACGVKTRTFALATLNTPAERKLKPSGDFENWLKPSEVVREVLNWLSSPNDLQNGNDVHLYRHSESFFHESYYQRLNRK